MNLDQLEIDTSSDYNIKIIPLSDINHIKK